jgi:hypothetical protein
MSAFPLPSGPSSTAMYNNDALGSHAATTLGFWMPPTIAMLPAMIQQPWVQPELQLANYAPMTGLPPVAPGPPTFGSPQPYALGDCRLLPATHGYDLSRFNAIGIAAASLLSQQLQYQLQWQM